jgi:hypothetical protein
VSISRPNQEVCKVTNSDPHVGGKNDLTCRFDMAAADTGAFVRRGRRTWVFFGDAAPGDSSAWFRGADPVGYFDGSDPIAGLCSDLPLLTVRGMKSQQSCTTDPDVFSPQVVTGPSWGESIRDFLFQPVAQPAGAPPLPPNSAIPGTDEAATGAFFHGGNTYIFFMGAQYLASSGQGLPIPNVSTLAVWDQGLSASNPYPTTLREISKVDYALNAAASPPQSPPPGWPSSPPLGGKFVQVAPVIGADGYLYIFGTGEYRKSFVYLARLPSSQITSIGQYLAQTPGFQVWTQTGWSASDLTSATPLPFPDDRNADTGEFSVQYSEQVGLWLMMMTNPAGTVVRWAPSPGGPWSRQIVVLDLSQPSAQQTYCCQGAEFKFDPTLQLPLWACTDEVGGQLVDDAQMVECVRAPAPKVGPLRYGLYAPYMIPFLTNVSSVSQTVDASRHVIDRFTVSYMISTFSPYDRVLLSYELQSDTIAGPDED